MDPDRIAAIAQAQPPFALHLGLRLVSASPERVEAELPVAPALLNRNGTLHGGAVMGLADNLGGTLTFLNLGEGEGTSTIESKTNFFRPVAGGDVARAVSTLLHKGRRTVVVETRIFTGGGKLAALVVQTQMVTRVEG